LIHFYKRQFLIIKMATVNGTMVAANKQSEMLEESGFFEDAQMGNLEHLNTLLVKYIKMVQALEEQEASTGVSRRNTIINVNIDRSKLIKVGTKYEKEITDWKKKCEEADKEIAALLAKIAQLEADIKLLKKRNADKDAAIWDKDLTIEKLKAELSGLEIALSLAQQQKTRFEAQLKAVRDKIADIGNNLNTVVTAYMKEKERSGALAADLKATEKDLRFKIAVLGAKLETESSSANIDLSTIDTQIKDRYQVKMDSQLQMLKKMYTQHMEACTTSLESLYKKKITDLEKEIGQVPKPAEQDAEFQELQVQLESCRMKSTELDANNLELVSKQKVLEATVAERKRFYDDQLSAKDRELKRLQDDHSAIKMKYDKLMKELDWKEVREYSNILTPEISRIGSRGRFGIESYVNTGKTLNFSHHDDSVVIIKGEKSSYSSDSDSDSEAGKAKKTAKVIQDAKSSAVTAVKVEAKMVESNKAEAGVIDTSKMSGGRVAEASVAEASRVTQSSTVTSQQVSSSKKTSKATSKKN